MENLKFLDSRAFQNRFSSVLPLVNWDTVWRANTTAKFQVSTELNRNVGLLRLFPGITSATVRTSANEPYETVQTLSLVIGGTCDTAERRDQRAHTLLLQSINHAANKKSISLLQILY